MPAVICNTSVRQYLHQIDLLDLLPALFGQVQIPNSDFSLGYGQPTRVCIYTLL